MFRFTLAVFTLQKIEIGLILDHTMASPFCAEALPYCDIAVESLTKFACGKRQYFDGSCNGERKFALSRPDKIRN